MMNIRPPRTPRLRSAFLLALAVAPLTGCKQGSGLSGKVIEGELSFVGIVDATDERLKAAGLPGVEVTAGSDPNRPASAAILGRTKTGSRGDFSLWITEPSAYTRPAAFTATKDGYIAATGAMPIPTSDRRVLIIMKPTAPASTKAPEKPR